MSATLQAEIEKFMVSAGPTVEDDPPSGWPDKDEGAPSGTSGLTTGGASATAVNVTGLTAGAFTGGYFSLSTDSAIPGAQSPDPEPAGFYGEGIEIVSNTATQVLLAEALTDGQGELTATIAATSSDQRLFDIGDTNVALVTKVTNIDTGGAMAVDASVIGHDLSTGDVGVGEDPDGPVSIGDDIEFKYRKAFAGSPASGLGYLCIPPRTTQPADFTTGEAWAEAYTQYFLAGTPTPVPGPVAAAKAACRATIETMMAVPGMAPIAITSGLLAFWGAVSGAAATIWPALTAVSAVPPPGIFAVGPAVLAATAPTIPVPVPTEPFSSYEARAKVDAGLIAVAIHTASAGGQIITQPGSSPVPITFVLT